MRYIIQLLLAAWVLSFQGCDLQQEQSDFVPFVPDNTPLVVGVLEATADTVHHYPEVFVGTVSNPEGVEVEYTREVKGIWWPVTGAQVAGSCTWMDLERTPDTGASVVIVGPMGEPEETQVEFTHEAQGVYGDRDYRLPLIGGKSYKLAVTMSDGRAYTATTRLPELFEWSVADTAEIELKLGRYANGIYNEQDVRPVDMNFAVSSDVGYITYHTNSEYDYQNFDVPEGKFLFEDRSKFLREGAAFGIFDAELFTSKKSIYLGWDESSDDPLRHSEYWWLSLYQLNSDLSRYYYSPFSMMGTEPGGPWEQRDFNQNRAFVERDTTYLFDISNILKVAEDGSIYPKKQTDAIGVFGGYSAAYRNTTVIPVRSWDPDTLNWGTN
jgi:hypothetical protein